jgi:hypothetical protein
MFNTTNVVGLEILVSRIDDAVAVFVDAFGWDVVFRGPSGEISGERAVLDAGSITVTLLEPAEHGPKLLSDRAPRVTQLIVGGDADEMAAATDRLTGLGLPTHSGGPGRRFVPPEAVAGVLGFETALMLQEIDDGTDQVGTDRVETVEADG